MCGIKRVRVRALCSSPTIKEFYPVQPVHPGLEFAGSSRNTFDNSMYPHADQK